MIRSGSISISTYRLFFLLLLSLTATTSTGCRLGGSALASRELPTPAALGRWAAGQLVRALETGAAVDEYAQDQLIIFMALASGRSRMLAGSELTLHTRTAMHIIEQMVPQVGQGFHFVV